MSLEGGAEAAYCSGSMPRLPSAPPVALNGAPSSLHADDLRALARGEHADPFAVLGPHRAGDAIVVRVLVSGAARARVRVGRRFIECARVHGGNVFEGTVALGAPIDPATGRLQYKLEITHAGGAVETRDDPYRFGPVLDEDELARLAAGAHERVGDALGAHVATHQGAKGVRFAVWAPDARRVSVVGGMND